MRTTFRVVVIAIVAGLAGHLSQTPAGAQLPVDVTVDEFRCLSNAADRAATFFKSKGSCVQRCLVDARQNSGPYDDCFSPYGGSTATCLAAAEAKARDAIVDRCDVDCPECFGPQVCSTGDPLVANISQVTDVQSELVYCTEAGGQTPTEAAARCESTVSKSLAKFVARRIDCYSGCFTAVARGIIPFATCTPLPTDPRATACIARAESKTAAKIDAACVGNTPSCYTVFATGAEWVGVMAGAIDGQVQNVACTD